MTTLLIAAFLLGAMGSFHCIGMCGPIALAIPGMTHDHGRMFISSLLYNAGRICTYVTLGLLFGAIGFSVNQIGFQQWLSVALGIAILIFMFFPNNKLARLNFISRSMKIIRTQLGDLFRKKNYRSVFAVGLLNGLIPCGLVYMALATAVAAASPLRSAALMAAFGLGTLPLMWAFTFFGSVLSTSLRSKLRKVQPVMMVIVAVLLILRGLNIGDMNTHHHNYITRSVIECFK